MDLYTVFGLVLVVAVVILIVVIAKRKKVNDPEVTETYSPEDTDGDYPTVTRSIPSGTYPTTFGVKPSFVRASRTSPNTMASGYNSDGIDPLTTLLVVDALSSNHHDNTAANTNFTDAPSSTPSEPCAAPTDYSSPTQDCTPATSPSYEAPSTSYETPSYDYGSSSSSYDSGSSYSSDSGSSSSSDF